MGIRDSWHGSRDHNPTVVRASRPIYQFRSSRYAEDYELISDFETIGNWTLTAGDSIAADTVNFKEGLQGIRWRSVNNVTTIASRTISLTALGKHFTIWVYVDNPDNLNYLAFYFRSIDATWNHCYSVVVDGTFTRGGWSKLSLSRACLTPTGAPDWANITMVRMNVRSAVGTTVNVTFDDYRMVRDRFSAKVTLRFDDSLISQYTEARPRMDKYGFRGIAAVTIRDVGVTGMMSLAQLQHLQERGWDIVSHTMTHPALTSIPPAEVENELWNSQRWLVENGFYKGSRFFIIPGTNWNLSVMEQIKKYYLGCQTSRYMPWIYATIPPSDPYRIIFTEVTNTTLVATVTGWIDGAKAHQAWLTLLFHIIGAGGYPVADFQSIIDYIDAQGVEVVTFSDVFDELLGSTLGVNTQLLEYGVQDVITPNATSYPCPGGGVAAQTANEIKIPVSRGGWLKNLRVKQRVASGGAGLTGIYTVRVNGVDTGLTCTLNNATVGSDLVHSVIVSPGNEVSVKLVSNNVADTSADISATVELEPLM